MWLALSCHFCFRLSICWYMVWNLPLKALQLLVRDKPVSVWMPDTIPVTASCFPGFKMDGVCTGSTRNKTDTEMSYLFFLSKLWAKNPIINFYRHEVNVHKNFFWCVPLVSEWVLQRSARPWNTLSAAPFALVVSVYVLCSGMYAWSACNFGVTCLELRFLHTVFSKRCFAGNEKSFDRKRDFRLTETCLCEEIRTKMRALVVVEEPFACK